jgi:hypothetical protein
MTRVSLALVVAILASVTSPASGDPGKVLVPAEADSAIIDLAQAIMPGSVFAFARRFDQPLLDAAADSTGRFLLALGGRSFTLIGLSPMGDIRWKHDVVTAPAYVPHSASLSVMSSGIVMTSYALDEDVGRYMIFSPEGKVAFDDTLHDWGPELAPCGKYFYRRDQDAREIVLYRIAGDTLHVPLPAPKKGLDPLEHYPTHVSFPFPGRALATTNFENGKFRMLLIDLSVEPPVLTELDIPTSADWHRPYEPIVGTESGDLLVYEPEDSISYYHISSYSRDGRLRWRSSARMTDWEPELLISARDCPVAALLTNRVLKTFDTRTGQMLDSAVIWQESDWWIGWIDEQRLERGRLLMVVHGGNTGGERAIAQVEIDDEGKIGSSDLRESRVWDSMWGLGADQPMLGIAQRNADTVFTVYGFRK